MNEPYRIVLLTAENAFHLPLEQEPIDVIGYLVPVFDGNQWVPKERPLEKPMQKCYPTEVFDPLTYVDNAEQAGYLAMLGDECVGTLRVSKRWQKNAFIDDIAVNRAHRGRGIGTRLMDAAVNWGQTHGCYGMSLETQNWNLLAIRFYFKYGFRLGGIDTCVYKQLPEPYKNETALYLYMLD